MEVTGYLQLLPSFHFVGFRDGIQVGRQGAGNAFSSAFFTHRGLPLEGTTIPRVFRSQITLPGNALMDLPADASLAGSSPS